jgi:hypothetical protein
MTGLNIDYSIVSPGAGLVQGIVYTGPSVTTAKTKGQGALVLNSRASAMSSFQNRVRNKSSVAGSIWGLFWDDVNFEGAAAASVLTGQTHAVTIDCVTNVDAATNNAEVMGVRLLIPSSANANMRGLYVESAQSGGHAIQVNLLPTTVGSASAALNLTVIPSGASAVKGALITMGALTTNTGYALRTEWLSTAGGTLNSFGINAASTAAATFTTLLRLGALTTTCVLGGPRSLSSLRA